MYGANAKICRATHVYVDACALMEAVLKVIFADFEVMAAEAVIEWARAKYIEEVNSAARTFNFRSDFKFGRITAKACPKEGGGGPQEGTIPPLAEADKGCSEVDRVFVRGLGYTIDHDTHCCRPWYWRCRTCAPLLRR